jgi:hypothetical protein
MKAPINGKRFTFSAVVKIKSSFPPTGIMVRKDSKSLKVFIGFTGDIYPTTNLKKYRLYRGLHGRT